MNTHKHIMQLFVAYCKLALRLLILLCECSELLDWVGLRDGEAEFDVSFCVFVTGLDNK